MWVVKTGCVGQKQAVGRRNGVVGIEMGDGVLKQVVGFENRWWEGPKRVLGGQLHVVVGGGWCKQATGSGKTYKKGLFSCQKRRKQKKDILKAETTEYILSFERCAFCRCCLKWWHS